MIIKHLRIVTGVSATRDFGFILAHDLEAKSALLERELVHQGNMEIRRFQEGVASFTSNNSLHRARSTMPGDVSFALRLGASSAQVDGIASSTPRS